MSRKNDDRQARLDLHEFFGQGQPIFSSQPQVSNSDVKRFLPSSRERIATTGARRHRKPKRRQPHPQQMQQSFVIIYNENAFLLHDGP